MLNFLRKVYKKPRLIILDLFLLNFALVLSFWLRFDARTYKQLNINYFIILTILGFVALHRTNLYNRVWKYASIDELRAIIKTSVVINILFTIGLFFLQLSFSRSVIIFNGILDIFFLGGLRFLLRITSDYLNHMTSSEAKDKVLIVGAGDAGEMIIREMQKHPEMGKEIVGIIDDDPNKIGLEIHGKKVLGSRSLIPSIIQNKDVDEVIIAIPSAQGQDIKELYNLSNQDGVKVKIVPGVYEIINGDVDINQIREVKVEDLLRREQINLITSEITGYIENKTVLVTGGGGSIGSELCRQMSRFKPKQLIIFDFNENETYFLERELKEKYKGLDIISIIGSIRDVEKLKYTFSRYRPDVVFHAAAHKHVPLMENSPEEAVKNNIIGTQNVVMAADEFSVNRFVLISTDKAVNPTNVMGATKRVAEMIIQAINERSNTKFMAVRFGNVLGSKGSVIPLFKKQIEKGGPVTVTHPEVKRYFMTIPEAVQLVIQAGAIGNGGEVFVLDMGEPVKIIDLAKDLIRLSGLKPDNDIPIEFTGLRPGEKLFEELLNENEDNLTTQHDRIFIANLEKVDDKYLSNMIKKLEVYTRKASQKGIIKTLEKIVDTYQPLRDNVEKVIYHEELMSKQRKQVAAGKEN